MNGYPRASQQRLQERIVISAQRAGGVCPPVLMRDQEKRWVSCSSRVEPRFIWRITTAPTSFVDYVVAHVVVRDHASRF